VPSAGVIRRATRTYLLHGGKAVVWLNIPFMRDPRRNVTVTAVDVALYRAVAGINDASVLDMAGLFTPGAVYRDDMTINGRTVRVRESDGIHLSPEGAAIAAGAVVQGLEQLHAI
jgi:hypothetical protein